MAQPYFIIRSESDPELIGVTNGIKQADILREGFENPENYDHLMSNLGSRNYWNIKHLIPQMRFKLECVKLLPEAIRTDFLMFGPALIGAPFLISAKVSRILDDCKLHNTRRFPANVLDQEGSTHPYELLYQETMNDSVVDFGKSIYYTGSSLTGRKHVRFASSEEKEDFAEENFDLKYEELHLNDEFDQSLDLFLIRNGARVISGRLRNKLEEAKATGLIVLPCTNGTEGNPVLIAPYM